MSFLALLNSPSAADTQSPSSPTAISLATFGSAYTQNFDSLAANGTSSTLPGGWAFLETGSNSNSTYTAGTGSSGTGDTYSFGVSGVNSSADRAFGTVRSGTVVSTLGATFANNTAGTISSLDISYRGELWRLGDTSGRTDELDFQYSTDATSLSSGTWTNFSTLNFVTPTTAGSTGARDGNASGNFTSVSVSITGLSIAGGAAFWIRWLDIDASGSDDGLAIDDFSLTPQSASGTSTWTGGGANNNWSTSANWNSAPANGSSLIFAGATRLSNSNNSLSSLGSITFDNTAGSFALSGNALTTSGGITNNSSSSQSIGLNLTLGAAQQFNAASGSLTLSGAIANGGNVLTITGSSNTMMSGVVSGSGALVKSGAGTLTLSGNNSYGGGTTVSAGTLIANHFSALGGGGLTINNSATAKIADGAGTVVLPGVNINAGSAAPIATFDIGANSVIIPYSGSSPFSTIQAQVLYASHHLAFDRPGITSSSADGFSTAVAYAEASELFIDNGGTYVNHQSSSQSGANTVISNQAVILKYTWIGDTDLDGDVDAVDFNSLFSNLGTTSGADWAMGDTDGNGTVDEIDSSNLFANLGAAGLTGGASPPVAVPEPGTSALALLGMAAIAAVAGHRRRLATYNSSGPVAPAPSPMFSSEIKQAHGLSPMGLFVSTCFTNLRTFLTL